MASRDKLIWWMQGGIEQARALQRQGDLEGARNVLEQVATDARRGGVRSSHLYWRRAAVCGKLDDLPAAFGHIHRALEEDPLSPEVIESYQMLLAHLRSILGSPARAVDDPSTPELYRILLREERSTIAPHLAMAKWLAEGDRMGEAIDLARAAANLFPGSVKAWRLLAKLAFVAGDKATTREARARAAKAQSAATREQPAPRPTQSKAKA